MNSTQKLPSSASFSIQNVFAFGVSGNSWQRAENRFDRYIFDDTFRLCLDLYKLSQKGKACQARICAYWCMNLFIIINNRKHIYSEEFLVFVYFCGLAFTKFGDWQFYVSNFAPSMQTVQNSHSHFTHAYVIHFVWSKVCDSSHVFNVFLHCAQNNKIFRVENENTSYEKISRTMSLKCLLTIHSYALSVYHNHNLILYEMFETENRKCHLEFTW